MNTNFHYAAIKVIARHAGFSPDDSQTIAYASQFVDDASLHEPINLDRDPRIEGIRFDQDEFDPICTAHKDIDYLTNLTKPRAHRRVYVCFHFIPRMRGAPDRPTWRRTSKDCALARELVEKPVLRLEGMPRRRSQKRTRELIRLGVALHSYADTWAHQGFSGFHESDDNDIGRLRIRKDGEWCGVDVLSKLVSYAAPDIGHAEAGTLPDRSDVAWDCQPAKTRPERDNTREFLDAARSILAFLGRLHEQPGSWRALRPRLKRCLRDPAEDVNDADCSWNRVFPEVGFRYDPDEWFDAALARDGGFLDLVGDKLGIDPLDYTVKDDARYFLFHAVAKRQRDIVLRRIRPD